jgi:hypothetical protein
MEAMAGEKIIIIIIIIMETETEIEEGQKSLPSFFLSFLLIQFSMLL